MNLHWFPWWRRSPPDSPLPSPLASPPVTAGDLLAGGRHWYDHWLEASIILFVGVISWRTVLAVGQTNHVVVAVRDIAKHSEITPDDISLAKLPHIEGAAVAEDTSVVIGATALEPIAAGTPLFGVAVARPQAFAADTIRKGAMIAASNVVFKSAPYVEKAVTSPTSLRRRTNVEIPAGNVIRESMLDSPQRANSYAAARDDDVIGKVLRDLAPAQAIGDDDFRLLITERPPGEAVTTAALFANDPLRAGDVVFLPPGQTIAAYRVFAGPLRPRRGSVVTIAAASGMTETAILLSITPAGDAATVLVALAPEAARRLAAVPQSSLQLRMTTGGPVDGNPR